MNKYIKWIVVFGLGVVTSLLTYFWLQSVKTDQVSFKILRAKIDITADETAFSEDVFEEVRLPEEFRDELGGSIVGADEATRSALAGRIFTRDVKAGSFLLLEYLETDPQGELSSALRPGRRALTLPVNASATVGYFVEPGSIVDILGTVVEVAPATEEVSPTLPTMRLVTLTLMQAVPVLAVGRARAPGEYRRIAERGYDTVTVDVSPEEAEKLVFGMQQVQGGLTLVLRNPSDTGAVTTPSVNWQDWQALLSSKDKKP